jgi:hypothetical protein
MYSTRYSCQILIKLEFSRHIFEKYPTIQFHENLSSGRRVVSSGRMDGHEANSSFSQDWVAPINGPYITTEGDLFHNFEIYIYTSNADNHQAA